MTEQCAAPQGLQASKASRLPRPPGLQGLQGSKASRPPRPPSHQGQQCLQASKTLAGRVSDIAEEVTNENLSEDVVDEVCSDKEYGIKAPLKINEGTTIPKVDGIYDAEVLYTFVSD